MPPLAASAPRHAAYKAVELVEDERRTTPTMREEDGSRRNPFEWDSPLHLAEKIEMAISCLFLVPLIRAILSIVCAALGALWCLVVYYLFYAFGADPSKHPPLVRRVRVVIIRYPVMVIQRVWLFCLGFHWIHVKGHRVYCGVWWGDPAKVVVANHTGFLDMLIMVWQINPSFLGKRAILSIPLIGTVGFVNEMIAVDRETIASGSGASTKERIVAHIQDPHAPPLMVFPEGTTCRNDTLLQFKAGGAFAHGLAVQPVALAYRRRNFAPLWKGYADGFDYANTPATDSKLWALRLLCRWHHGLTVTYLPPVVPTPANGLAAAPVAFANAARDALAQALGPATQVTEQS